MIVNYVFDPLSYMQGDEYLAIMKENGYLRSQAVRAYEKEVAYWNNVCKELIKHRDAHPDQAETYAKLLEEPTQKRIEAAWSAISIAELEKEQRWRLVEDADAFMDYLKAKYHDDLSLMREDEKLQMELVTKIDSKIRRQKETKTG